MKNLFRYIIARTLMTIPMVFILLTIIFAVLRLMPGDPVSAMLGGHAPEKVIEQKREQLGLNRPMHVQYADYIWDVCHLDLGESMVLQQKVTDAIADKLPATIELTFFGMLITLVIGIFLGAYAADKRRTMMDSAIRLYGIVVYCIPVYWLGLMLQLVFGIWQTRPKIAVYEAGDGAITRELEAMEAVDLVAAGSADEVTALVEDKKADVGVVFGEETKKRLEAGERAQVDMYISGESLAKNRAIALAALTGAVRSVSPEVPRVYFEQVRLGEEKALSLMDMFLPFMVIYVILLGGLMLTSSFVVNEKEKRTFAALLVTPVTLPEVLIAFGLVGVIVSLVMGIILMLLTVGFAQPLLMFAIFALGSLLGVEWGLLLGMMSRD